MTPADRRTLAHKLDYLRKQLELLQPYRASSKEALFGGTDRLIVERLLETSIQSIIDCSRLLVALEDWRKIRDERDALLVLVERKIIPQSLAERLLQAKGFRNILVHEYVDINPDLLLAHLHDGVDDLWAFARGLAEWINEHE